MPLSQLTKDLFPLPSLCPDYHREPLEKVVKNEQVCVLGVCVMLYTCVYLHLLGSFLSSCVGYWFDQMVLSLGEPIFDFGGILFVSTEY